MVKHLMHDSHGVLRGEWMRRRFRVSPNLLLIERMPHFY
jgi:hypothetical protein